MYRLIYLILNSEKHIVSKLMKELSQQDLATKYVMMAIE